MPAALQQNMTMSFYGDSISDFTVFGTYNMSLYRELGGRIRLAENDGFVNSGVVFNNRPGWDAAIAGTTVSAITSRFVDLVARDEADIVFVLMGANGYGTSGPGTGTAQDWRDRADDIVAAAEAAHKILVFLPPISHRGDVTGGMGRDVLRAYIPTLASDTVVVPDTSAFDFRVHTDDGVHPNQLGSALLAAVVGDALASWLPTDYDWSGLNNSAVNLLGNGDLNGSGGMLAGAALGFTRGEVADGWTLKRTGGTGTAIGEKFISATGDEVQVLRYIGGKGEVRLGQTVVVNGHAGEQYEIAIKIKVIDPNFQFLGFRAFDSEGTDGVLFDKTPIPILARGGTGSFETVVRSAKFTLETDQASASVNLAAMFGGSSASIEIQDVILRKVDVAIIPGGDPVVQPDTLLGTAANDRLIAGDNAAVLIGAGGNDVLLGGVHNDTLAGGGGVDTLTGGGGSDVFQLTEAPVPGNFDRIVDFQSGLDQIMLSAPGYDALGGDLTADEFFVGARAYTPDQNVIYNAATGQLFWDVDGVGGAAQVLIAVFVGTPALDITDFVL
jgi:Ca2+-binding RTX toxin-like protein